MDKSFVNNLKMQKNVIYLEYIWVFEKSCVKTNKKRAALLTSGKKLAKLHLQVAAAGGCPFEAALLL